MTALRLVRRDGIPSLGFAAIFALLVPTTLADTVTRLDATTRTLVREQLTGDETDRFQVTARGGQTLSVDLYADNASASFTIWSEEADTALFAGMQKGNVADVPLPTDGDYRIEVFLVRAAARRGEMAHYSLAVALGPPDYADSLAGGPDAWRVALKDTDSRLNVRRGPDARYPTLNALANGEILENRGCRLSGDIRWCRIRAAGSGQRGWVAGRYLVEAPPISYPRMPNDAHLDNSRPFDAVTEIACQLGDMTAACPLGVIRDGPGNAGLWIVLPDDRTRHVLIENGAVVDVSGGESHDYRITQDTEGYEIHLGDEYYRIPRAIVDGG
ncbi:SH3 domain-containing protein [Salinicola avicenniae]|uniref:SH3 domain-containing protein n=1 Tax=Salinicola avicenniae TaxID=2916836 RepID=UPI002072D230|nr:MULTISPECIES: SH3 domain-containing protein [unclassified Salinicola]